MNKYLNFIKMNIFSPYTILTLFLVLFIVRVLYLDADPYFLKTVGDMGDEGYWAYNARNAVLFNNWIIDDFNQAIATAPLFSLMLFASFKLLGIGYFQDRIISAVAGWLTLVVLYFFIKDAWNKKAALISLVILGFNAIFIMFNRLGMVESTVILFLLLTYYLWYKSNLNPIFYVLSGICFSFALLTKITSFYFIPALIVLWILEKIRKNLQLKNIIIFVFSAAIPFLIYLLFILIPYWTELSPFLISVSGKQNLATYTLGIFNFLSSSFFGFIPVFLLLIPSILYLANLFSKLKPEKPLFSNMEELLIKMNYIEIVALSWLVGGTIGLLFSDLSERRFLIFFIPLVIIFTKVLVDKHEFNLNMIVWKLTNIATKGSLILKIVLAFLIVIPLFSILINLGTLIHFPDYYTYLNILILTFVSVASLLILSYLNRREIRYMFAAVILLSLGCIIALPFFPFLQSIIFNLSWVINIPSNYSLIYGILLFCLFFYLFFAFKWQKNIGPKFISSILIIYILFNFAVIGTQISNPTFTISENSKYINNYTEKGDITIGFWSHELSLENRILPLWYLPNDPQFKYINSNISKYSPKFILVAKTFDKNKNADLNTIYPKISSYPNHKFIKEFDLYPYPYTNNYRIIIYLYKITG